jgi:enolase
VINSIKGRQVIDSRGNPTVEAEVTTNKGTFSAIVPSGASTGIYEAVELRDGDKSQYLGKSVNNAVNNINTVIAQALKGRNVGEQLSLDNTMVQELDGSKNEWGWNKAKLGANSVLAVSLAIARAGASSANVPLYQYIAELAGNNTDKFVMPVPSLNVINGGSHAGNKLAMQEFMILPTGAGSFREAIQIGCEVYQTLKVVIKKRYGGDACNVGDEGGFAPNIQNNEEALELLMEAISKAGHAGKVEIGMDVAASEFYRAEDKTYDLDFKNPNNDGSQRISAEQLLQMYEGFVEKYPIVSIEDPFDQDDFDGYALMTKKLGSKVQIVGDDLLVTNPSRINIAKEKSACNALLLKVNQIGSISESIEACNLS